MLTGWELLHQQEQELVGDATLVVAGIDEAGRGPWAGPVTAGAVILPTDKNILKALAGVNDSKQLTPRKREILSREIIEVAIDFAIGEASANEIDRLGIVPSTHLAMRRAWESLSSRPELLLIDGREKFNDLEIPYQSIIKGDGNILSIAAASILAKVHRDEQLEEFHQSHPQYGFAWHKGYGTALHRLALEIFGASPLHRTSYRPVAAAMEVANASNPFLEIWEPIKSALSHGSIFDWSQVPQPIIDQLPANESLFFELYAKQHHKKINPDGHKNPTPKNRF